VGAILPGRKQNDRIALENEVAIDSSSEKPLRRLKFSKLKRVENDRRDSRDDSVLLRQELCNC